MKFRKKAVVVEAQQWFPPGDERHDPSMLSNRKGNTANPPDYLQAGDLYQFSKVPGAGDDIFMLRTPRGNVRVYPGEWIITPHTGEKFPCDPNIFAVTYEPVDGGERKGVSDERE